MTRIVVFDFDGVLVDSNRVKEEAWYAVFPESEGVSRAVIDRVRARIPETRFDILRAIALEVNRSGAAVERFVETYAARYHALVEDAIALRGLRPDASVALAALAERWHLYINSATPESPLRDTVVLLGIAHHFHGIFGRPASKVENLARIAKNEHAAPEEMVMIGDGESDAAAAAEFGCRFVGFSNNENQWREKNFPLVARFADLESCIDAQ